MRDFSPHHPANPSRWSGMAPLEFVFALPVLLLLMVALTWLGFSVIGQTEVTVEARNKAWAKRFDDKQKKPLEFTTSPRYSRSADFVTEKANKKVKVSPMFDKLPGPESSHTILAGSWDHRAMPLNEPPNWKLHAIAAASATTGELQEGLANIENIDNLLMDAVGAALADAASEIASRTGMSGGDGSIENLGSVPDSKPQNTAAGEDSTKQEQAQKKAELTAEKNRLEAEIAQVDRELQQLLEEQSKESGSIPIGEDSAEKQAEALRRMQKIELLQIKKQRLNSDLTDVKAELKAAG